MWVSSTVQPRTRPWAYTSRFSRLLANAGFVGRPATTGRPWISRATAVVVQRRAQVGHDERVRLPFRRRSLGLVERRDEEGMVGQFDRAYCPRGINAHDVQSFGGKRCRKLRVQLIVAGVRLRDDLAVHNAPQMGVRRDGHRQCAVQCRSVRRVVGERAGHRCDKERAALRRGLGVLGVNDTGDIESIL